MRTRRAGIAALALVLGLMLAACMSDKTGSVPAAPARPIAAPAERAAGGEHEKLVALFGGEYRAPQAQKLLEEIVAKLVPATERPDETYRVTLLDSPVINAFAMPSGQLYATRGLLALAGDTAEIAAVLAHEIAHVTLRHALQRGELEARSALVSKVVADVLNDPVAGAMVRDQSRFTLARFSRGQELEADQIGVRTLAKAGYDPYGASRFLTTLGRWQSLKIGVDMSAPDMLSTHPATQERIALALQAARQIGAPGVGEKDRARYLAVLDGISFGDNPADGLVRGRRFLHPRLGIGFTAPPGFTLDNTEKAVLGLSENGAQRLLFDAVEAAAGQSLEDVLRGTWSDAIETGVVETTRINDFPAVLAISRGKDWTFRLAVMEIGRKTYRLILAAKQPGPDWERGFREMLDSVRQLSPEEARALRPLRLKVVTAETREVETLAQRSAFEDRVVERFSILNGLGRGAGVIPGERYKIVVE